MSSSMKTSSNTLNPSPSNYDWLDEQEEQALGIPKQYKIKSPKKESPKQADCNSENMEQCLEVVKDSNIIKEALEKEITELNKIEKKTEKECLSIESNIKNTTRNLRDIESKIASLTKTQKDHKDKLEEYKSIFIYKSDEINSVSDEITDKTKTLDKIIKKLSLYKNILPKKKRFILWGGRTTRRSIKNNKRITRRD